MFQPKLVDHLKKMQGQAAAYIEPATYTDHEGKSVATEQDNEGRALRSFERDTMFIRDTLYYLDGPEQREAQAEAEWDYVAETDVTASNTYGGRTADAALLKHDLAVFIAAAHQLDRHKKVLFRKRTQEEAGLPAYNPGDRASVGFFFIDDEADLLHGIIGIATESGELAEIALKKLEYPSRADIVNVREEMGDILWYMARLMKWAGTSFLAEMRRNIAKLRNRHGASFNVERDGNRDLTAERLILENGSVVGFSESEPITGKETFSAEEVAAGQAHSPARVNTQVRDFPDEMISGVDPAPGKLSDES